MRQDSIIHRVCDQRTLNPDCDDVYARVAYAITQQEGPGALDRSLDSWLDISILPLVVILISVAERSVQFWKKSL